jgi:hypothetical protein
MSMANLTEGTNTGAAIATNLTLFLNNIFLLILSYLDTPQRRKKMRLESDKYHRHTSISKQMHDSIATFLHFCYLNSTTSFNLDSLLSLPTGSSKSLDVLNNIHSLDDFAENNMFPIKPTCHDLPNVNTNLVKK